MFARQMKIYFMLAFVYQTSLLSHKIARLFDTLNRQNLMRHNRSYESRLGDFTELRMRFSVALGNMSALSQLEKYINIELNTGLIIMTLT